MKKPHKPIPSPRDLKGTIRRQPVVFAVYLVLRLIVLGTLVSSIIRGAAWEMSQCPRDAG